MRPTEVTHGIAISPQFTCLCGALSAHRDITMKNILGQAVQITLNYHAGIAPTNATASDHERVVNHTTRVRLMLLISLASDSPRARTEGPHGA